MRRGFGWSMDGEGDLIAAHKYAMNINEYSVLEDE